MTIIGLVRHGMTAWNEAGRLQGQRDTPLNESGRRQAEALAERLASETWDVIVASDLQRAYETATIIAFHQSHQPDVLMDQRIRERNYGLLEGTTLSERLAKWGEHWKSIDLGVESDEELQKRGRTFIDDAVQRYQNQRILVVSHGGFLGQLFYCLLGSKKKEPIKNTSLSKMELKNGRFNELLFNCTSHLSSKH